MNYLFYPGCSLRSTGRAYEESMNEVFDAVGIHLEEIRDWNCCGATAYASIDERKAFALAARNLALAEAQRSGSNGSRVDIIAPCSACYLVLSKTRHYLEEYEEVRKEVGAGLAEAGLRYTGVANVRHPLDVLINDIGLAAIAKMVKRPLKGMKIASYYGCQVVRPFATFDHPQYPTTMDKLMAALGATPVDWPLKTRCCGGSLTGTIPEAGLRLNRALLKEAQKRGADAVVTCCPLCQHNLECYQGKINRRYEEAIDIPVAYFTQLMGIAFGLDEKRLGLKRLFRRPSVPPAAVKGGATVHA